MVTEIKKEIKKLEAKEEKKFTEFDRKTEEIKKLISNVKEKHYKYLNQEEMYILNDKIIKKINLLKKEMYEDRMDEKMINMFENLKKYIKNIDDRKEMERNLKIDTKIEQIEKIFKI